MSTDRIDLLGAYLEMLKREDVDVLAYGNAPKAFENIRKGINEDLDRARQRVDMIKDGTVSGDLRYNEGMVCGLECALMQVYRFMPND